MEKIVHSQLYTYCTDHRILNDCQLGFRKEHFTVMCLIDFLANIFDQIDDGRACGVLFLDLRKAFDTVNHKVLLTKLKNYGIRPSALSWFDFYLTDRFQSTKVGQAFSSALPIVCGVPRCCSPNGASVCTRHLQTGRCIELFFQSLLLPNLQM